MAGSYYFGPLVAPLQRREITPGYGDRSLSAEYLDVVEVLKHHLLAVGEGKRRVSLMILPPSSGIKLGLTHIRDQPFDT